MTIRERLKSETASQHQALEDNMDLLREDYTLGEYQALIQAFHDFYAPLEAAITARQAELPPALDWPRRIKLPQLEADLRVLGVTDQGRMAGPADLPPLGNLAEILGVLYVIEGSTLGGMVISRHFQKFLGLDATNGASFYVGYGAETGPMWKQFLTVLEAELTTDADADACVKAAAETFDRMSDWLKPARDRRARVAA